MILIWLLALGLQLRFGEAYPEGRPDCPVLGHWLDNEGNRSLSVSEVKPGIIDYLRLESAEKYLLKYQNNWDTHQGEVRSRHGNFLLAGVVPSVQKPEHLLYLVMACYSKELWILAVPYMSGDYHSSAFFKMTPVVTRTSDDAEPHPSSNESDSKILVNVSMWAGHLNDTQLPAQP